MIDDIPEELGVLIAVVVPFDEVPVDACDCVDKGKVEFEFELEVEIEFEGVGVEIDGDEVSEDDGVETDSEGPDDVMVEVLVDGGGDCDVDGIGEVVGSVVGGDEVVPPVVDAVLAGGEDESDGVEVVILDGSGGTVDEADEPVSDVETSTV